MSTLRVNTITPQSGSTNQLSGSLLVTDALTVNGASAFVNATFTQLLTGTTFSGSAATFSGNVTAATLTGTLQTAAQTNITSVGTLTSLTVSGAITGATSTNTINGLIINSGGLGGATGVKFGIGTAFSSGQAEAYTTSTTPMGIGTVGAQPLRFYTNSALVAAFDSSGNLAVDTNTLYVDAANNRVGVGTATPNSSYSALQVKTVSSGYSLDLIGNAGNDGQISFWNAAQSTNHAYLSTSSGNSRFDIVAGASYALAFGAGNTANQMRLDTSGNLGLGVTPSAWSTSFGIKALQISSGALVGSDSDINLRYNSYFDGSNTRYTKTGTTSLFEMSGNVFNWYSAASGTAGNVISFGAAKMTLDASGNLGVGTTSPTGRVDVAMTAGSLTGYSLSLGGVEVGTLKGNSSTGEIRIGGTYTNYFPTFYSNGTERARITSGGYFKASDNGTYVSSTATFHELNQSANNNTVILENTNASMTSTVCLLRAARNTTNNTFYAYEYYNTGAGASKFRVADSGSISTAGSIQLGDAGAPPTSGVGVKFPATQSASSDANTLDDYEEGTWTATLKGSTSDPTTPVTTTGKYTKIGRLVQVTAYFNNVDTTGAAGTVSVTGLPFAEDGTRPIGSLATYNFDLNNGTSLWLDLSGTTLYFNASRDDGAWVDVLHNAGANRYARFTATYNV